MTMTCTLTATVEALRHPIVIIGYGNPLRRDDSIGLRVVTEVARWGLPNVRSLTSQQLTPELAEALAEAEVAIFVDARHSADPEEVTVVSLQPNAPGTPQSPFSSPGHTSHPSALLALTQVVYGHVPQAWWVQVPAADFGIGEQTSAIAEQGISDALEKIETLIRTHSHPHLTPST
jgi:hydrogenase maturation protease